MNKFLKDIANDLSYMAYAPRVFISALTGQRVIKMLDTVKEVYANNNLRVSTGVLNDVLVEAMAMQQPPAEKGRQLKIY